jgi:S-DNA-T family DNA segregation ATPase FtsK/SpoIIIE
VQQVQVARPADGLAEAVARIAAASGPPAARPPVRIGVLPTDVDPAVLAGAARLHGDPWEIPVGIASGTLAPAALTLHEGEHALVAGPARSGRSTTLATVAEVVRAARPDACIVAVATPRSPLAHHTAPDRVLAPGGLRGALDDLLTVSAPVLVLVDDADAVDDEDGGLAALLSAGRAELHVVSAGGNERLRSGYGHWTRLVRSSRTALLLQPDVDLDGDLAGVTLPRRTIVELTPGRGYLVAGGSPDVVQIARSSLHESD